MRSRWRPPELGARASIALHVGAMLLCGVAIQADTAPTLAWVLFWLNAVGAALVGLGRWGG